MILYAGQKKEKEVLKNKLKLKFYAKNLRENRFDFMAVIRVKFKWSSVVN